MAQLELRLTVPSVRVRVGPPPARAEVQPARQSPDQTWIPGHWARRGNDNVWIGGVWARPPRDGMAWERERWEQRNNAWYYAEGHWRWTDQPNADAAYEPRAHDEVAVEQAPPRNLRERRPRAPFRNAVWMRGYWDWDGSHHNWVEGRYSARQRNATWTPDRWTRTRNRGRGQDSRWVLVPGHWNRRQ